MKKRLIGISIIVFCLLIVVAFFSMKYILNFYSGDYFKFDYDKNWKVLESSKRSITLKDKNDSIMQIVSKELDQEEKSKDLKDIYFDLEEDFLKQNKDFKLINYGDVEVGENYLDGYEYLYEHNGYETLLIIVVKDFNAVLISCTANSVFFDYELKKFYEVINTLEI